MSENSMNEASYIDLYAYARNSDLKLENSQETQSSTIGWACTKIIPDLFGGRVGRVIGTYKDEGKSASRKKVRRPDFERLMADIEAGKVRVLVVVNLSRFSRLHHVNLSGFTPSCTSTASHSFPLMTGRSSPSTS